MKIQTQNQIQTIAKPTIIVEQNPLSDCLDRVADIVQRKTTRKVLTNVLVKGYGNYATLTTTDLDMELTIRIACAADSHFNSTVPAKKLKDLAKKVKNSGDVIISENTADDEISLDFGKVKYNLPAIEANEFERLNDFEDETTSFTLDGKWFLDCLNSIYLGMSTEETRYYLNGVYMEYSEGSLNFVAVDGHRLFKRSIEAPEGASHLKDGLGLSGVIIPRKSILALMKLIKGKRTPETITVKCDESKLSFVFDDVELKTKLVDGNFPDYRRVIPQHNTKVASFDAKQMIEAIDATSLISEQKSRAIKLKLFVDTCDLSMSSDDDSTANTSIPCGYDGEEFEAGFNSSYLKDMVQVACPKGGVVSARFENTNAPALFTSEIEDWLGVLMPMRT